RDTFTALYYSRLPSSPRRYTLSLHDALPIYKGKFKLAGLKLSNENYGVGVKKGDTETVDKVNKALEKMVSDGAWKEAVEKNFGPANYTYEEAPKIGQYVQ